MSEILDSFIGMPPIVFSIAQIGRSCKKREPVGSLFFFRFLPPCLRWFGRGLKFLRFRRQFLIVLHRPKLFVGNFNLNNLKLHMGTESSEYERRENIKMSLSDSFERILTERFWLLLAVKSNPSETKKQRTDKTSVLWEY